MADVVLGDLSGPVYEPLVFSFAYFGETIRVHPELSETTVVDLYVRAADVEIDDGANDKFGEQLVKGAREQQEYIRAHIHPEDFDRFWALAKKHRQKIGDLMVLSLRLVAAMAERDPTSPPSASSDGRPGTKPISPPGVSEPDGGESPEVPGWWPEGVPYSPQAANFVDTFEQRGRPDLANMVMLAQEARAEASASTTG